VASERQIAANRANSRKSAGPKSRAGKARASQNAYRHGLAARRPVDASWIVKVEILAAEIVNSTAGLVDLGRARCIAGAELEVQRVRATTEATIAQIFAVVTTMIKGLHSRSAKTQRRHCRRWRRGPSNWPKQYNARFQ